jgi:hypothetical protein
MKRKFVAHDNSTRISGIDVVSLATALELISRPTPRSFRLMPTFDSASSSSVSSHAFHISNCSAAPLPPQ